MIISDIDGTLINEQGDYTGLDELRRLLRERDNRFVFGIASGRSLQKIRSVLERFEIPTPDVVIASVGTYMYYGYQEQHLDKGWLAYINRQWYPDRIRECLDAIEGLELQEPENLNPFKISYYLRDPAIRLELIRERLGRLAHQVNVVLTQSTYLDILPRRASKGRAVRYLANKWSIPLKQVVVCGDAGNDLDMLCTAAAGVVVGNHAPELELLRGNKSIYFAQAVSAAGILEGLRHYGLLDAVAA